MFRTRGFILGKTAVCTIMVWHVARFLYHNVTYHTIPYHNCTNGRLPEFEPLGSKRVEDIKIKG